MYISSTITFTISATIGCGFLLCTASLLSLKQRAYEIKRREERTKIVFGALQVAASLFGSWMLTERNRRLDASIDAIEHRNFPTKRLLYSSTRASSSRATRTSNTKRKQKTRRR